MSSRRRLAIAVVIALVAITAACPAFAAFTSAIVPSGAGLTVSTATLADPTSLSAVNNAGACVNNNAASLEVDLTWVATASARATGYRVLRNGTQVATVGGASATGWADQTGALQFATAYTYVVESVVGQWSSPGTVATATVTTLAHNCK
jgi:hypothetical protein